MARWSVVVVTGVIAFLNATAWAVITPAFQGPDEEAHVAYVEHLAATGKPPDSSPARAFASGEVRRALGATRHYSVIFGIPGTRPPWRASEERDYRRSLSASPVRRDDGGGRTGASANSPVSYALPAAAARVGGGSFFDRLLAMRLACALLAGLAAAFVCATALELLPRAPWAAAAAGLGMAFQPMFGFISGTVNPDAAAAAAGAILLYLLVRALRRGFTPAVGAGIAAALVLGTLAKLSVLALAPAVLLALAVLVRRGAAPARALAATAGTAATLIGAWLALASHLGHEALSGAGGQVVLPAIPGVAPAPAAPVDIGDRLAYLWQVFLPPLPFMQDVYTGDSPTLAVPFYVKSAWGAFGWQRIAFSDGVYALIAAAIALALALMAVTAWRRRDALRARAPELAVLAVAFVSLAVATHLNFARAEPGPFVFEQGRYLFPAAAAVAVGGLGACYAFGRRWAPVLATAAVTGMMVFSGLCQLFVFTTYYT